MKRALERHDAGTARVIPVILRPVDLYETPFAHLQCLPRDNKPVTSWSDRDEAFREITIVIRMAIVELHSCSSPIRVPPISCESAEPSASAQAST